MVLSELLQQLHQNICWASECEIRPQPHLYFKIASGFKVQPCTNGYLYIEHLVRGQALVT